VFRLLALDAALLSVLIVGIALSLDRAAAALARTLGMGPTLARALVVAGAGLVAAPLVLGIGRLAHRVGVTLAVTALPKPARTGDLAGAPRRALVVTLQLGIALATGILVLAVTQPFLPGYSGWPVLALLVAGFGVAIWRSADLESHVRAGAQAVVEALTAYARTGSAGPEAQALHDVHRLLPGLGEPVAVKFGVASPSVGRSLAELNLRGRTGATVLAISRGGESVAVPAAGERIGAGDVVALAGTHDAIEAAKSVLLA